MKANERQRTDGIEYKQRRERFNHWRVDLVSKPVARHNIAKMYAFNAEILIFYEKWGARTVWYTFLSIPYKSRGLRIECRLLPRTEGSRTAV